MSDPESEYDYIFGFGSIMNTSTHATWQPPDKKGSPGAAPIPGAIATIKKRFGYRREWNFRSATGFTALGVIKADNGIDNSEASDINGVLFRVAREEMPNFDRREVGYEKISVPLDCLEFNPELSGSTPQATFQFHPGSNNLPSNESNENESNQGKDNKNKIWLYVPLPSQTHDADENHPLLQSYVDTVLQGCLEWGGEPMAESFILTTGGWSRYYLNDTPSGRRPWLFRKQYAAIDQLLSKHSFRTRYGDRRHPEEFASAFNQRMKGTWSIPRRNPNFTGRERELDELRSRFSSSSLSFSLKGGGTTNTKENQRIVRKIEVAGMGGVGKTQLVTEYCYRYFPSEYGLVVWLNAETVDTLVTDYRQLLADLANVDADMDKSTDELVGEVKSRLFRSNVPWLLVFDNIEDHALLDKFVPRGAGTKGHVIVTTRHMESSEAGADADGTLFLGCLDTMEAVELLRRSAGEHNVEGPSNARAAEELCEKLGNLPLALSMAAGYMRQCDVECAEYLGRYNASEKNGQSLLMRRGKLLPDYSLTVASSLSLILPKIEEENETTAMVLHLLSFLGPDGITKHLLRNLLGAKKDFDERRCQELMQKRALKHNSLVACLVLGVGAVLSLPAMKVGRRAGICTVLATAATSVLVLSRGAGRLGISGESAHSSPSLKRVPSTSFSYFEYEQCDISWDVLKSWALLSVKEGKGSVHRLLQQAIRSCQTEEEGAYYLMICIDAVVSCWTFKPSEVSTWKESLLMLEHVKSAVMHFSEFCCCDEARFTREAVLKVAQLSKEAGILSAMALNAFVEAMSSLELSLKLLEMSSDAKKPDFRRARAHSLHKLSKIRRYQGRYDDVHQCLMDSLALNKSDDCLTADSLHELGICEMKKHNLDAAASFLQKSLEIRRGLGEDYGGQTNASSTLHQLAATHISRKPPSLDTAKALLREALSLSRQVGQRAATLKALARVTIRQGELDQADRYLGMALELYQEMYGENNLHINIAAVKFQQGALAQQREQLDEAWLHFYECLRIRRHVYAYARQATDGSNPIHLEVSCVLHELGAVGFGQKRFSQSIEMLQAEREILEKLDEQTERVHQARLTNLTWLRKCAKEMGDDGKATKFANERTGMMKKKSAQPKEKPRNLQTESFTLQQKAMQCRLLARKLALDKADSQIYQGELMSGLGELLQEIRRAAPGPMKQAATQFRDTILLWINKPGRRLPILSACDTLRDVLRAHGVEVNDSMLSASPSKKKSKKYRH
eukprot:CAMPEP_0183743682 /NCGR_PEP_ID=MMETSP0737-20130205/65340_1 /TAXON_ID=385413 /ORGANISM="Thalassiosira miniscula, Strain CCMP1093" /LENGTH=1249 /DNA_ID=CAMNT_0025979307 /DNA_START=695 /DNA_END=4444 /DNA_ORIENTATION=-